MRKIILHLHQSLDGIVSDPDKWMTMSDEIIEDADRSYEDLDTIITGGNTYPSLAAYWQKAVSAASSIERHFAQQINQIKKLVLSRTSKNLVWNNSQQLLIKDGESLTQQVMALKNQSGKDISVESGIKTWQLFLENDLFDELKLFIHPIIASTGTRLFSANSGVHQTKMRIINYKAYRNGVIGLHYKKIAVQ
jgi:dihydrofolate reductase